MTILETFIKLRDDLKLWVTNNLNQKANISYVDEKFDSISEFDPTDIQNAVNANTAAIDTKVDKVDGMGLSTNDYTTAEKDKLDAIEANANFYEHPTHDSHSLGLYKVTVDESGHVSGATLAEKEDIVALGIPAQDTTYEEEIEGLSGRLDDVENDISVIINETLNDLSGEFENYKETNNKAVSTNASGIEANKTAIEAIQGDYLTSIDKTQLEDNISKVSEKVTANASAIEILNGEGDGSVKQSIDNAFNEFAANVTNDDVVNTYKELIDYAAEHGPEFTELVGKVDTINTHVGEIEVDISNYKTAVSDQFTEVDTTINNHVTSTNNPHGVTKEQVGLANVDNTSDIEKPISNAMQEALDDKANLEHAHSDLYYDKDEIEELVTVEDIDEICGSNVIVGGGGGDANVVSYATKQWVQDGYQPKGNYLTSVPDGYATESYVNTKIAAIPTPDVSGQINTHNLANDAHNDIRLLVDGLTTRLNTLADCDDTTLDQMSEVVEYIKSNQSLIEGVTTKKVNVADIIDNLTTNVSNKPLSAAQGVVLSGLIEELTSNLSNYQPKGDYLTAVPAGYATEEFVTAKIAEAELGGEEVDLSVYAQKSEIPTKVSQLTNDSGFLTSHQNIDHKLDADQLPEAINTALAEAKESGVFDGEDGDSGVYIGPDEPTDENIMVWIDSDGNAVDENTIPDYVSEAADVVIEKIATAQTGRTFTFAAITDMHYGSWNYYEGITDYRDGVHHACQALKYIDERIKLDAVAVLGDYTDGMAQTQQGTAVADFKGVNAVLDKLRFAPNLRLQGNHDFVADKSPLAYRYISAYSDGAVEWGNPLGGYFYKDFGTQKIRVICLNTSEASNEYLSCSAAQYEWFINSLDLSAKADASEWGILILSHIPLDSWPGSGGAYRFAYILDAYKNGTSWTDNTVSCDFSNGRNAAVLVGCIHGHVHNFKMDKLYLGNIEGNPPQTDVWRLATPNACFGYENKDYTGYKEDTAYPKTENSATDTAFCVYCIDLDNHTIKAICYGAGYDRELTYYTEPVVITNVLPISTDASGDVYNASDTPGYKKDTRWSGSSDAEQGYTGLYLSGYIPISGGDTVYLKNVSFVQSTNNHYIWLYADKTKEAQSTHTGAFSDEYFPVWDSNGILTQFTIPANFTIEKFLRIQCGGFTADSIITINQPID